jgi:hypothetical protein
MLLVASSLAPASTSAQYDEIGLFADSSGGSCDIQDSGPGVVTVQVWHGANVEPLVLGSRFKLELSPGATLTYLYETVYVPVLEGDTQSGITLCYGTCRQAPAIVAAVTYQTYGTSATCSSIEVVPHPDADGIESIGCEAGFRTAVGYQLNINANAGDCPVCEGTLYGETSGFDFCQPIATERSTWGEIKALYR